MQTGAEAQVQQRKKEAGSWRDIRLLVLDIDSYIRTPKPKQCRLALLPPGRGAGGSRNGSVERLGGSLVEQSPILL